MVIVVDVTNSNEGAIYPEAGFRVRAVVGDLADVVCASPVKCRSPVGSPFVARGIFRRTFIVANVFALVGIVNARGYPHSPFLGDHFRDQRVCFVGNAIDRVCVNDVTFGFLVVRDMIFCTNYRSILLCPLGVESCRCEKWVQILPRVFGIASIWEDAASVCPKTRGGIFFTMAHFLAGALSVGVKRFKVPYDQGADRYEGDSAKVIYPPNLVPFVPRGLKASAVEAVYYPCFEGA